MQQGIYYIDDLIIDTLKHKVFKENQDLNINETRRVIINE